MSTVREILPRLKPGLSSWGRLVRSALLCACYVCDKNPDVVVEDVCARRVFNESRSRWRRIRNGKVLVQAVEQFNSGPSGYQSRDVEGAKTYVLSAGAHILTTKNYLVSLADVRINVGAFFISQI